MFSHEVFSRDEDRTCNKLDYLCNGWEILFRRKTGAGIYFLYLFGDNLINHINH